MIVDNLYLVVDHNQIVTLLSFQKSKNSMLVLWQFLTSNRQWTNSIYQHSIKMVQNTYLKQHYN